MGNILQLMGIEGGQRLQNGEMTVRQEYADVSYQENSKGEHFNHPRSDNS